MWLLLFNSELQSFESISGDIIFGINASFGGAALGSFWKGGQSQLKSLKSISQVCKLKGLNAFERINGICSASAADVTSLQSSEVLSCNGFKLYLLFLLQVKISDLLSDYSWPLTTISNRTHPAQSKHDNCQNKPEPKHKVIWTYLCTTLKQHHKHSCHCFPELSNLWQKTSISAMSDERKVTTHKQWRVHVWDYLAFHWQFLHPYIDRIAHMHCRLVSFLFVQL